MAIRPRRQPPSARRSPDATSACRSAAGFTLVELLVGAVLGSLVLGALGGAVLVSQMRVSASIRRDLASKDALNRAVALLRTEIGDGSMFTLLNSGGFGSSLCASGALRISRPGSNPICYMAVTAAELRYSNSQAYGSGTDRPWSGSCVLMREGPVYDPSTGELEAPPPVNIASRQVILDQLGPTPCASSFQVSTSGGAGVASKDVQITISQVNPSRTTSFRARSSYNPVFAAADAASYSTACSNGARHINFPPSQTHDQSCRNIYYLPGTYGSYTLSNCTFSSCTVNSTSLQNVDVLVFTDREIRP